MVTSSSHIFPKGNLDFVNINTANKINVKRFTQNGQIQIYQSSYRGSYSSIIRDSLRRATVISSPDSYTLDSLTAPLLIR